MLPIPVASAQRNALLLTFGLIAAVFVLRLFYLIWLSPYELVGDEAYYWEWSRHLDLCYDEKGPGIAWVLAGTLHLLGQSEWAIRLPVALSAAIAALVIAHLATQAAKGDARAGLCAAILFSLTPAYHANAQLCTQDGILIAIWVGSAALGWRLLRHWREQVPTLADWLLPATLLGIGFLFKPTVLLILPGFVAYLWMMRRSLRWSGLTVLHVLLSAALFAFIISPIFVWNMRHGWPTLQHTVGHLTGGGDQGDEAKIGVSILRPLSLIGSQIGSFGPAMIVLMTIACVIAIRSRHEDPDRWPLRLWMLCCAFPGILFFTGLSLLKAVLGTWPFPMFATLLAVVGEVAAVELSTHQKKIRGWRLQSSSKGRGRRPGNLFIGAWDVTLIYGICGALVISFPTLLTHLPLLKRIGERQMTRYAGHREEATKVALLVREIELKEGRSPLLIADYYQTAALLAFYLPSHPTVYNAEKLMGGRQSTYDLWVDTDLHRPELSGRSAILIGKESRRWSELFLFASIDRREPRLAVAKDYQHPIYVQAHR